MSEETQPTLEELASSITVEQTQPAKSYEPPPLPTFESPEDAAKWAAQQVGDVSHRLESIQSELRSEKEKSYIEGRLKALDSAVSEIGKDVPISKLMIEGVFHQKYSRDPAFQKIFDNRDSNPEAYKKALGVLKDEIKREASVKYDPEAEANSRALKQLQSSARSPAKVDPREKYRDMSASEFDQEWTKLLRG